MVAVLGVALGFAGLGGHNNDGCVHAAGSSGGVSGCDQDPNSSCKATGQIPQEAVAAEALAAAAMMVGTVAMVRKVAMNACCGQMAGNRGWGGASVGPVAEQGPVDTFL